MLEGGGEMMTEPVGLELRLSRDLISKYTSDAVIEQAVSRFKSAWQVVGRFDFLQIRPVYKLSDLEAPKSNGNGQQHIADVAIGAHSGILAVPFEWPRPGDSADSIVGVGSFAEFVRLVSARAGKATGPEAQSYPVLALARVCMAPIPFELWESYEGTLQAIESAKRIILKELASDNLTYTPPPVVAVLRGLSSAELVVIGLPQNAAELRGAGKLFRWISTIGIRSLVEDCQTHGSPATRGFQPDRSNLVGHAFASVNASLAFRPDDQNVFHWVDDGADLPAFSFGIRCDSGHDHAVCEELQRVADDVGYRMDLQLHSAFDRYRIRGMIYGFNAFVSMFWYPTWVRYNWKRANLIDTVSTVCEPFEDVHSDHESDHDIAWELAPDIWQGELQSIMQSICQWAETFLADAQRYELVNSVKTVHSCFLHHELASAVRDLMPFLRQLSFCVGEANHNLWHQYYRVSDLEEVSGQISALLIHLHRAVRNRLEQRASHADPTLPHTLEHGANKLVGAYTTSFWMCSELFSERNRVPTDDYCHAEQLAVCVAAGYEGQGQLSGIVYPVAAAG